MRDLRKEVGVVFCIMDEAVLFGRKSEDVREGEHLPDREDAKGGVVGPPSRNLPVLSGTPPRRFGNREGQGTTDLEPSC